MSGRIVHMGVEAHRCRPGWTGTSEGGEVHRTYPGGTVWQCGRCDRTWVRTWVQSEPPDGDPWRPESWRARRRRLRKERSGEAALQRRHPGHLSSPEPCVELPKVSGRPAAGAPGDPEVRGG